MGVGVEKLDFVTVCFADEIRLLELQARSMARYLDPSLIDTIHVIINERQPEPLIALFHDRIAPAYGPLLPRVKLVDYKTLWAGSSRRLGWISQQALKLLVARNSRQRAIVILDSKNHFIRPVRRDDLLAADGRLRSHLYPMARKFVPHYHRACRYFGYSGAIPDDMVLPTTTPFLADRDLILALLDAVEEKEECTFQDFFSREKGAYTEFCLYSAFHLYERGPFEHTYECRTGPTGTLFRGSASRPERAQKVLDSLTDEAKYCMGVHRQVLQTAHPQILKMISDTWHRFGLVTSPDEADYFLTVPSRTIRRRIAGFLEAFS